MSNEILNCAVVGLGIGEQHIRALLTHPRVKLSGICDFDHKKMADFLKKYTLDVSLAKSFSDILLDDNIDTVSIASFDDAHFDQVMACLQHNKHVFVEKPLCQTKNQLKEIYVAWKKSGLALRSNLILRKAPLYLWLKNQIETGALGEIYAIDMDYLYGRIHKITDEWRSKVDNYSVMAGGGIHLVDLMMQLMAQKPTHVQSCVNKIVTNKTAFKYHDFHAATFYFESGTIGRVTANFGCMHRHQHVVRIFGTKATFIYDDMGPRIHWKRDEDFYAEPISLIPKPVDKACLLLDFVSNILECDYKDSAKTEFDLMCAITTADQAIASNNYPLNIEYFT